MSNRIATGSDGRLRIHIALPGGGESVLVGPGPMLPEEEAVAALLNAHVELRPRHLPDGATCLRVDGAGETATWSTGHVTGIIPPRYATGVA